MEHEGMTMRLIILALSSSVLWTAFAQQNTASAVIQGSSATHRVYTDSSTGLVMVYTGGLFPTGTEPVAFRFLFDETSKGNTSGSITPLLFEATTFSSSTYYTVVGIGRPKVVQVDSAPQTIPFEVIEGRKVTNSGNYTFGFVNSLVNVEGVPYATSPGVVDFDLMADSGDGVAGIGSSNNWAASNYYPTIVVRLGTTFGSPETIVDYTFYQPNRTYSAQAIGYPNNTVTQR